ncbi:MAG: lysoplasmalogenase [Clostridia bacterium]|nr:lysoplasmalogenase [Clostridia bacterium]
MIKLSYYFFFIILCFIIQMLCKYFKREIPDLIFKCIISLTLFILATLVYKYYPIKNGAFIILGMGCGFIGDFILGVRRLKKINKKTKSILMIFGLISFFLGHIFYLNVFLFNISLETWQIAIIGFGSLLAFMFIDIVKDALNNFNKLLLPCQLYAFVILLIVFTTFFGAFNEGTFATIVLFIGAILFMTSDILLLILYFSKKEMSDSKKFSINFINLTTYFSAQFIYVIFPILLTMK